MFYVFGFTDPQACGVLAPWVGIETLSPALEGRVLTLEPVGRSL